MPAGGYYTDAAGTRQAFVAYETGGVWGAAVKVPGTVVNGDAEVTAVSVRRCGHAHCWCGYYNDDNSVQGAFVMDATNGAWGAARRVPGIASLSKAYANVTAGPARVRYCMAGGYYLHTGWQVFVAREKNGVWGKAITVPGTGALETGREASLTSISCGSPGNCAAGGYYRTGRPTPTRRSW